jgi:hypothetical protein
LNYILQTDVLPIGVTPVTAIPTRISHGPVAEAGIEFAEAQPQIIALSELPEFATEQENPGNKKHSRASLLSCRPTAWRKASHLSIRPGLAHSRLLALRKRLPIYRDAILGSS